jgi:hypothetical protein
LLAAIANEQRIQSNRERKSRGPGAGDRSSGQEERLVGQEITVNQLVPFGPEVESRAYVGEGGESHRTNKWNPVFEVSQQLSVSADWLKRSR